MIKAVIFDLDGTIADTLPICIAAFRRSVEPLAGRELSDEEIIASFGPSEEGTVRRLIPEKHEEALEGYLRHYREMHCLCPEPFDGIRELVAWLRKQNITVAMVTGKGEKSCRVTLDNYGMTALFDRIETGSPEGPCKRQGIESVLNRFNLCPEEAVYIGDAPSDITACREAGVLIAAAAWAKTADPEELLRMEPDCLCFSVAEIRSFLMREIND